MTVQIAPLNYERKFILFSKNSFNQMNQTLFKFFLPSATNYSTFYFPTLRINRPVCYENVRIKGLDYSVCIGKNSKMWTQSY